MEVTKEVINCVLALNPLTGFPWDEKVQKPGNRLFVEIYWAIGCNYLVDVAIFYNGEQILPRDGFLALNDTKKEEVFDLPLKRGDILTVEARNSDGVNPHTIVAIFTVKESANGTGG